MTNILVSWAIKIGALILAYFSPVKTVIHVMLIFLAIDLASGLFAAWKMKIKIESHKLRKTVFKLVWYTVAVMAAWMMEKTFNLGWANLANIAGGFICFVELKSIFENITRITDEPVFRSIIKLFQKKAKEKINNITDEISDNKSDDNASVQ